MPTLFLNVYLHFPNGMCCNTEKTDEAIDEIEVSQNNAFRISGWTALENKNDKSSVMLME